MIQPKGRRPIRRPGYRWSNEVLKDLRDLNYWSLAGASSQVESAAEYTVGSQAFGAIKIAVVAYVIEVSFKNGSLNMSKYFCAQRLFWLSGRVIKKIKDTVDLQSYIDRV